MRACRRSRSPAALADPRRGAHPPARGDARRPDGRGPAIEADETDEGGAGTARGAPARAVRARRDPTAPAPARRPGRSMRRPDPRPDRRRPRHGPPRDARLPRPARRPRGRRRGRRRRWRRWSRRTGCCPTSSSWTSDARPRRHRATAELKARHPASRSSPSPASSRRTGSPPRIEAGASGFLLKDAEADDLAAAIRAAHRGEVYLDPAVAGIVARRMRAGGDGTGRTRRRRPAWPG